MYSFQRKQNIDAVTGGGKGLATLKEIFKIQNGFRTHFHVQIVTFKGGQWLESYGPWKWFWKAIMEYFFFLNHVMFYKSTKSVVCKYGVESINLKNNTLFGIKKNPDINKWHDTLNYKT